MKMRRKTRFLAMGLMMAMVLICTAHADVTGTFPDIPEGAGYAEAVEALYVQGIITGDDQGNFNPDNTITRAEAAAIICRMMGVEDEAKAMTGSVFTDVPASHWAVGYVAKAAQLGIINGYGNGRFGPGDSVTYEQMVKMLVCAWGYESQATENGGWPDGYTQIAKELKIDEGVNLLKNTSCPRKDVAGLCYNISQIVPLDFEIGGF